MNKILILLALIGFVEWAVPTPAGAVSPRQFEHLIGVMRSAEPFSEADLTAIQEMNYADQTTLFELYGNPAYFSRDARIQSDLRKRLATARAEANGSFEPNWLLVPARYIETWALDPRIFDSFKVELHGETHYRWFLHPEDQHYRKKLKRYLQDNGEKIRIDTEGEARLTSSRTCLTKPSGSDRYWYVKSSLVSVKGPFESEDRVVNLDEASKSFMASNAVVRAIQMDEELATQGRSPRLTAMRPLLDAAFMYIRDLDLAVVIRETPNLRPGHMLLPAFSAIHERLGPKLAQVNFNDLKRERPTTYWRNHLVIPMAQAVAEMFYTTGLVSQNPHSQNYLIELARNFVPTGHVYLRDFADYEQIRFCKNSRLYKFWNKSRQTESKFTIRNFHLLWGSDDYLWLNQSEIKKWRKVYFMFFLNRFSSLLGVPFNQLTGLFDVEDKWPSIPLYQLSGAEWESWLPSCDGRQCSREFPCDGFVLDREMSGESFIPNFN